MPSLITFVNTLKSMSSSFLNRIQLRPMLAFGNSALWRSAMYSPFYEADIYTEMYCLLLASAMIGQSPSRPLAYT